jgi:hypothetical protein
MGFLDYDFHSRHKLSSSLTFILKYGVTPLIVIPLVVISVISLFNLKENWAILIFTLSFAFAFYWMFGQIKSVEADERFLYISNYVKTIKVPFSAIEEVREDLFINNHPITIRFRYKTGFGYEVTFIPYHSTSQFYLFKSHPVIEELRKLSKGRIK